MAEKFKKVMVGIQHHKRNNKHQGTTKFIEDAIAEAKAQVTFTLNFGKRITTAI